MAEEIEFYDVKSKDKFKTKDYEIRVKKGRSFAVAKSPSGTHECWKVVSKDAAQKAKDAGVPYKEIKEAA